MRAIDMAGSLDEHDAGTGSSGASSLLRLINLLSIKYTH